MKSKIDAMINEKRKPWHVEQTCLGGTPDPNTRTVVYRGEVIARFNTDRFHGWSRADDEALATLCDKLNEGATR